MESSLKKKNVTDNLFLRLRLCSAVYRLNSFVLMIRYFGNFKVIRYASTSLNRIVADKLHRVIVALNCLPDKVFFTGPKVVEVCKSSLESFALS